MNRNMASLLFLAVAVFFAGCSDHPDSFGDTASTGSPATPVPDTDLTAFARAGIVDPESADARMVNDVNFVSDENPDAFNDVF